MSTDLTALTAAIERGAADAGTPLTRTAPVRWAGRIVNGASPALVVRCAERWLLFDLEANGSAPPLTPAGLWTALGQNAAAGDAIHLTATSARRLALRANLWLAEDGDVTGRVREIVAALQQPWPGAPRATALVPTDWAASLEQRCEESGWPCVRRSSGRLTVALATSPARQAMASPAGQGVRWSVELADCAAAPALGRAAAAVLALETSAGLRLVRAVTDAGGTRLGFETVFTTVPDVEELAAGFEELSIAATLAADALEALPDENLAGDYLAIRGWAAAFHPQPIERTNT